MISLQEHNQHAMVGDVNCFGGYDRFYLGAANYSSLAMLVRHDLQPHVALNQTSS